MSERFCHTVLTAYKDKICFIALQRYGVIKSAIMSGQKQTAANIQPIQDGSLQLIQQQFLQRNLFINTESFRVDHLANNFLVLSNPANKFIQYVVVVSDPTLQQIVVVGANSFQTQKGLFEVGDIMAEMFRMQKKLVVANIKSQQQPVPDNKQKKLTSFMEYDFAHPQQFVFKFKCFDHYYQQKSDNQNYSGQTMQSYNPESFYAGGTAETDLQFNQLNDQQPTNPLDASLTLFALIDNDSPRRLQTAFELYELQQSVPEISVVLCFKQLTRAQLTQVIGDAQFLKKMNLVVDIGNAEGFLKNNEYAFYTFTEDEEEIFADYAEMQEYIQAKFSYAPVCVEDRALYQQHENGNKVVVNGLGNPLVNEPSGYAGQQKFFVFYFKENIDNLNYLLNEIYSLQLNNADLYVVAALNPRQYGEYYYLRQKYPQFENLNVAVDKQNAGFYFIRPGHTHTIYYQDRESDELVFHMEQINELLACEDVNLQRGEIEGQKDLIEKENGTVFFQGIEFRCVSYQRLSEGDEVQPDPADNPRMKVQGKQVLCLLRNCFDYDEQLYQFYVISNRIKMDFVVCFAGAVDAEIKDAFERMSVLNQLIIWKDVTQKGAQLLQKADTLIRFYLINDQDQIYNSADDVYILDQLIRSEFQSRYIAQARNSARIAMGNPKFMVYEGRAYDYLNNHRPFDEQKTSHVSIFFAFLPPVSRVVNYDDFKRLLSDMQRVEKNYELNMNILCVLGMAPDMVRQISDLTNLLQKTQVVIDNGTKIDEVYKRLNKVRGKHDLFIIETFTLGQEDASIQSEPIHVFQDVRALELFLHDEILGQNEPMPDVSQV